jgi:hypothetical protein
MRSRDAILARCLGATTDERVALVPFLAYADAQPFFVAHPPPSEEEWERDRAPYRQNFSTLFKDYVFFTWQEIRRGHWEGVGRSLDRLTAWLWVIEQDSLLDRLASEVDPICRFALIYELLGMGALPTSLFALETAS